MKENINNLHKMWKERNFKLPKYRSPLFEKALLSEEDCKKFESDKLESKKLLYLNRENYVKEKIQLPPINILLRKENSQRIKLIKNLRTTLNKKDNFKTMRTNSVVDKNKVKSKLNISLGNIRKNQKQTICLPYANAIKRLFLRLWNYRINEGRAKEERRIIGGSTFFRHFQKLISRLHENCLLHTFFRRYSKILPQFLSYNKKMCYICTLKLIHNID